MNRWLIVEFYNHNQWKLHENIYFFRSMINLYVYSAKCILWTNIQVKKLLKWGMNRILSYIVKSEFQNATRMSHIIRWTIAIRSRKRQNRDKGVEPLDYKEKTGMMNFHILPTIQRAFEQFKNEREGDL